MIKRILLFLILNFTALGIGGMFTGTGVSSDWYQNLNKAPWTPPGWMFGAAWTLIMVCFAIYMAYLIKAHVDRKKIILLFSIQWILNVAWNPLFFYSQNILGGMICITLLTLLIAYLFFHFWKDLRVKSIFLAPYLVWLLIATSLNAYILIFN
jgi:tryptophan-rich sensory protein